MKTILLLALFSVSCSYKLVPLDSAPKSYIVEKKEVDKWDSDYSYFYAKSIVTGEYKLTLDYRTKIADVGDTIMVKMFRDGIRVILSSKYPKMRTIEDAL
jgi:hypothetical protein